MRVEGEKSCIAQVTEGLCKNEWVHRALRYTVPNQKPPFHPRCELQSSQIAYLSACHTTVGDENSPNELTHLTSATQFAGTM
ncbi:hypothetical protein J3R82DRAFT_1715 [Butyriboletus roseoflavus]|nr:hypothetical protein J3R82DRAFT_1715 [Butyriboletus roseoflavus]